MKYHHIQSLFIANRGEIAYRIIRTAARMGIRTILPVVKEEQAHLSALEADEVIILEDRSLSETFLNIGRMVQLATESGADAVHPGYGFLSENPEFARHIIEAGLLWIGPSPDAIANMGDKLRARQVAQNAGVSIARAAVGGPEEIMQDIENLSYPLLIKASAGGGGKAMQIVNREADLKTQLYKASNESLRYFGNPTIYVEEYIQSPRHIEVQVLGDQEGHVVHLYERECSIQRRYQKIIEEAPSPFVDEELRNRLTKDALRLCREIDYYNAGTVEFLVSPQGQHYFLEMNTRLQVEHPVTEAITGIDLVEQQIRIAMGYPLSFNQEEIPMKGHALEARLYAEDALNNFSPSPGHVHYLKWPTDHMARTDTSLSGSAEILPDYDPMLAKITTHGDTREAARARLSESLKNTVITGITTNLPFLLQIINTAPFIAGNTNTHFIQTHHETLREAILPNGDQKTQLLMAAYTVWLALYRQSEKGSLWYKLGHQRWNGKQRLSLNNKTHEIQFHLSESENKIKWQWNGMEKPVITKIRFSKNHMSFFLNQEKQNLAWYYHGDQTLFLEADGHSYPIKPGYRLNRDHRKDENLRPLSNLLEAPLPGRVVTLHAMPGEYLEKGMPVLTLEAMKTENTISAPFAGFLSEIKTTEGENVKTGQLLAILEPGQTENNQQKNTNLQQTTEP